MKKEQFFNISAISRSLSFKKDSSVIRKALESPDENFKTHLTAEELEEMSKVILSYAQEQATKLYQCARMKRGEETPADYISYIRHHAQQQVRYLDPTFIDCMVISDFKQIEQNLVKTVLMSYLGRPATKEDFEKCTFVATKEMIEQETKAIVYNGLNLGYFKYEFSPSGYTSKHTIKFMPIPLQHENRSIDKSYKSNEKV